MGFHWYGTLMYETCDNTQAFVLWWSVASCGFQADPSIRPVRPVWPVHGEPVNSSHGQLVTA